MATSDIISGGNIEPRGLEEEMRSAYLDYAMSVIVGRALPDVRDGLKPVHRRVLFAMNEAGLQPNRPYSKCARIVGDVMGKYHPHGDSAIYDTLVRLAQDFSMRNPLVDGQGNFGSVDDDPAAAMRYCVVGETRVGLPLGTVPIAELAADLEPNSEADARYSVLDRLARPVKASKIFHSGDHPTLKVRTREGYELTGTHNHPLLCLVDVVGVPMLMWKRLDEMHAGDRVVIQRTPRPTAGELTPDERSLAELLGAFVSEGWASETRAGFNNTDQAFFDRVVAAFDEHVGGPRYVSSRVIKSGSVCHELDIHNLDAMRESFLAPLIGYKAAGKTIPELVWRSTPGFKRAFLQALFTGDGSSSLLPRKTIQVSYSSYSRRLARDVQNLLLEFGVISRLCGPTERGEYKVVITNRRDARLFARRVGFLGTKQRKLQRELRAIPLTSRALSHDHVPYVSAYVREEGAARYTERDWLRRHNVDRIERWERDGSEIRARITNAEVREVVEPLISGDHYYAEVTAIEDAGVQPVYSLRVDTDDHAFITDGFVSHNTEARLAPLAREMLRDLDADTVDFQPNYDGNDSEPTVLPARFPNLLVNGSSGIAVGMATNIPPHNLRETIDATIAFIDNPQIDTAGLMQHLKGPDFPTGGTIVGVAGIQEAYETGRGRVRIRAKAHIEPLTHGKEAIVVTELPFQVKKGGDTGLIRKIVELVNEKKISEISDLRDESDRNGMRLVIELKRDALPKVVLNKLYKHTPLQSTFGVNMVALVDNVPRTLPLLGVIRFYVDHQREVVVRRAKHELRSLEAQVHRLEGLLIALDHLDAVIDLIRKSADRDDARTGLMTSFGLTHIQAQAILEIRLQQLTSMEADAIKREHADKVERIRELRELLGDEGMVMSLIKDELREISETYGDERRTDIQFSEDDMDIEDLIADQQMVISITSTGYIKSLPLATYRQQRRGGVGIIGMDTKEDDYIEHLFVCSTHDYLLFFTNQGRVYRSKVYDLPEAPRTSKGRYLGNVLPLLEGETVRSVLATRDFTESQYLLFATRDGIVKKTEMQAFNTRIEAKGLIAIKIREDDELVVVRRVDPGDEVLMTSRAGLTVRWSEDEARSMGRDTSGVRGMNVSDKDNWLLAMDIARPGEDLLVVTEGGFGKRTPVDQYRKTSRGTKGVKTITQSDARGALAAALVVKEHQELVFISQNGMVQRTGVRGINRYGRAAQGVKVMNIKDEDTVSAVALVVESETSTAATVEEGAIVDASADGEVVVVEADEAGIVAAEEDGDDVIEPSAEEDLVERNADEVDTADDALED